MTDIEDILNERFPNRVYSVEESVVWVSGMNQHCTLLAERMARELQAEGIPVGLVYDDDAVRFGGVQFNYGDSACR